MCVTISQWEISGKNHICSVKTQTPPEHSLPVREKIHWNEHHFGTRWKLCVAYWPPFYTPNCSCSHKGLVPCKMLSQEIWERFQLIEISTVWQPNLIISHAKSGWKRVVKEMMTGSLYRFPFSRPANFSCASHFRVFPTLSRLPTIGEPGTGSSRPVCRVWQVHAQFFIKRSLCTPELQHYMRQL